MKEGREILGGVGREILKLDGSCIFLMSLKREVIKIIRFDNARMAKRINRYTGRPIKLNKYITCFIGFSFSRGKNVLLDDVVWFSVVKFFI